MTSNIQTETTRYDIFLEKKTTQVAGYPGRVVLYQLKL